MYPEDENVFLALGDYALKPDEYQAVGDIVFMIRIETEDTFLLPFITVTSLVQDASTFDFTFDINAAQYI
ncbi:hypothetical protein ARMGADRAFT_1076729 [Armillaria gallica]|uniref:Uncharacterized protein n=1 Tax=Armillaria gallica TaxID=47427 RepID=A0A2H3DR69_ARMGA|nr:hypothetical protein ARMGADRAFT_1076729 [Armillaria gallica]